MLSLLDWQQVCNSWNEIKEHYDGGDINLNLPKNFRLELNEDQEDIDFLEEEARTIFDPSYDQILEAIRGYDFEKLLICGGTARNPYLKAKIKAAYPNAEHVPDSDLAVCEYCYRVPLRHARMAID